jgi:DNA replication protein DnaC
LEDLINRMGENMSRGNTPTSSNTESEDGPCPKCGAEPICGGLGVIRYEVPIEDPRFGKLFRCPNFPLEQDFERQQRLRKLSNLGAYADKMFDNFITHRPELAAAEQHSLELAYRVAMNFAADPTGWLLLEGLYGSGKTHLAAAVGNTRLIHGDMVLFITTPDLLDHLRNTYNPSSEMEYDDMFERIRSVPLLILDDLGAENPSSWALEKLFQLLNHRYSHRLPTVITTNINLDTLDPRIRSRLLDENLIHRVKIVAPDYRTSVQNQYDQLSNLALYGDMTFDTFDTRKKLTPEERVNLERALDSARSYAERPEGWMVLTGIFGCGKTHLAAAIAHRQQEMGVNVLFVTVPDLLDYLRVTYSPGAPVSFDQRFHRVRNTPLLILDDLGTENATSWAKEKLFQIIDYRYVSNLPTVITTPHSIEAMDARIRTRLTDRRRCVVFAITAPDYPSRSRRR